MAGWLMHRKLLQEEKVDDVTQAGASWGSWCSPGNGPRPWGRCEVSATGNYSAFFFFLNEQVAQCIVFILGSQV